MLLFLQIPVYLCIPLYSPVVDELCLIPPGVQPHSTRVVESADFAGLSFCHIASRHIHTIGGSWGWKWKIPEIRISKPKFPDFGRYLGNISGSLNMFTVWC